MKKSFFLLAATLSAGALAPLSQAQVITPDAKPIAPPAASLSDVQLRALGEGVAFPYEKLDSVLATSVDKEGRIIYSKAKGSNDLDTFVRAVAVADLTKFPQWMIPPDPEDPKAKATPDRSPELIFWINAYNGLFLKTIADAYPVNSPSQIPDLDKAKTRVVAGQTYSFADMRRKIAEIDARALFALPDGTVEGPRAAPGVYRYIGLNEQLNAAARAFVNDITRVTAPNRLQNSVAVSPWLATVDEYFRPDATRRKWEGIRKVLAGYTTRSADRNYFVTGDYEVLFLPSDRTLSEKLTR